MNSTEPRIHGIEVQYRRARGLLLVVVALGAIANGGLYWYASAERPGPTLMQFTEARATGPTALCPGDVLRYDVSLHVSGPGVFDLDVAVFRLTPPVTVVFSSTRRMVFSGPSDYQLARQWRIPQTYSSPVDGSPERWAAGQYERRHAITTASRSTVPSIVMIPFSIRDNCP